MSRNVSHRGISRGAELSDAAQACELPLTELLRVFKLLADETRLLILVRLMQSGEQHVRSLCEHLQQGQPAVSHHLALLRQAGLIACRRSGKHNFYRLSAPWLQSMLEDWSRPLADHALGDESSERRDESSEHRNGPALAAEPLEVLV